MGPARTAGTHGNSLGVSICSSANNYSQTAVTTTSAEEEGRDKQQYLLQMHLFLVLVT